MSAPTCSSTRRTSRLGLHPDAAGRVRDGLAWVADRGQESCCSGRDDEDGAAPRKLAARSASRQLGGFLAGRHDELAGGAARHRERRADRRRRPARADRAGPGDPGARRARAGGMGRRHLRARSRPYHDLQQSRTGIDPALPVAAICSSGQRSAVAASLLARHGAQRGDPRRRRRRPDLGARRPVEALPRRQRLRHPAGPDRRRAIFSSVAEVDLNVVCKHCGSEVSPYITECPYCGQRLRKRAPKLKQEGDGSSSRRPKQRRQAPAAPQARERRSGRSPGWRRSGPTPRSR